MPAISQTSSLDKCHYIISKRTTEKQLKRIPRPPNAFMLYRSDFLKSKAIPPDVEKRQQNLSRIAGQCWNMLPASEKEVWFTKAVAVREEHRAKYPCYAIEKGTKRLSSKDKRGGSGDSFGRVRTRPTRGAPYCEGMFAALCDPKPLSLVAQTCLNSAVPTSVSPLSMPGSHSPLSLPHVLPSTFDSGKPNLPSDPDNSPIKSGPFGYLLVSLGPGTPQWGLPGVVRDLDIAPSDIDCSSPESSPTPQRHQEDLSRISYPSLSELPNSLDDPASQFPLIVPGSCIFPSASADSSDCYPLSSEFNFMDALTHCNQSSYPWYSNVSA